MAEATPTPGPVHCSGWLARLWPGRITVPKLTPLCWPVGNAVITFMKEANAAIFFLRNHTTFDEVQPKMKGLHRSFSKYRPWFGIEWFELYETSMRAIIKIRLTDANRHVVSPTIWANGYELLYNEGCVVHGGLTQRRSVAGASRWTQLAAWLGRP